MTHKIKDKKLFGPNCIKDPDPVFSRIRIRIRVTQKDRIRPDPDPDPQTLIRTHIIQIKKKTFAEVAKDA